ncbi:MAG: hypothetical protein WED09_07420 [Homoserinimonas sp.]
MKTRSTFEPMPKRPSTDVEAVEAPTNHGLPSIFYGFLAVVGLLLFGFIVFLAAVAVYR